MAGRLSVIIWLKKHLFASITLLALAVLLAVAAVWSLSASARIEIDKLATANGDSTQWSLAQAEVELLAYQVVLQKALGDNSERYLPDVRQRFNIVYSRVATIATASVFEVVRSDPDVTAALKRIRSLFDEHTLFIDGTDAQLRSALYSLAGHIPAIREDIRTVSLGGVAVFARKSEIQRARVAQALSDLGVISLALLAVCITGGAVLVINMRVTHRKTHEVAEARNHLRAIISTSIDAVLVVDRDGVVRDYNGAAEAVFGYTRDEAVGANMSDLILPDHFRAAHDAGMKRYRESGEKRVVGSGLLKLEAKRKTGETFPVELSINATNTGETEMFVSFIRDISKRVADENELVDARDRALAAEKAKSNFLAVMSHEMRTPLNGVLGALQLLATTPLEERQRGLVDVMGTSGRMLLDQINNVLDISRVEGGAVEAVNAVFDLPQLVDDITGSLAAAARARGNALTCDLNPKAMRWVIGDRKRLMQVLVNLLGNANKFTHDGQITLDVEAERNSDIIEFRVTDTGIGIADSDIARIFDDFVTLDASFEREVEGSGLGLGIVRRLVQLMGGEVGVESVVGEGSVFWVRLPLPRGEAVELQPIAGETLSAVDGARILLVEDNSINRMVAREMLAGMGIAVDEATNGREGVDAAAQQRFDLILMDISMPKMGGIAATEAIREGDGPNRTTPIVALTAHAMAEDIAKFQAAGMSEFLAKPLSMGQLSDLLKRMGVLAASRAVASPPLAPDGTSDDTPDALDGLDAEMAAYVRRRVRDELVHSMDSLSGLVAAGDDREAVAALAHKLAGSAAVGGLADLHRALAGLETAARTDHGDIAGALEAVSSIAASIIETVDA